MDLGTLIRILIKRWYVVIPVVAITLATAFQLGRSMEPAYQARGAVLLLGPNSAGDEQLNPLAELRSPLNTTALAISIIAVDQQTRTEIQALGFQGTYEVDVTPNTPIVNVRVRAKTPDQALLTLEAVIEAVELKLDERQRGVEAPESTLIQTEVLTRTTSARALYGSRDRAVTMVVGLGLIAAASAAILLNSWTTRRERVERFDIPGSSPAPAGAAPPGGNLDFESLSRFDEASLHDADDLFDDIDIDSDDADDVIVAADTSSRRNGSAPWWRRRHLRPQAAAKSTDLVVETDPHDPADLEVSAGDTSEAAESAIEADTDDLAGLDFDSEFSPPPNGIDPVSEWLDDDAGPTAGSSSVQSSDEH